MLTVATGGTVTLPARSCSSAGAAQWDERCQGTDTITYSRLSGAAAAARWPAESVAS